ncbi:glycosyl hydrolase family 18 protein [uncultured Bacteroides sp.]|uniref:glycoside hydrolase family 18 protein n=1 Tax=uncultured Bacteroides sp. TaxID=162156 RepID=UPI002AA74BA5|nr:glycosyl hydrolase family 18 protein [uncultured Bacteroides sp.]
MKPVILAYVTSWDRSIPDPEVLTHINYAFGHVTQSFDGVRINNEERLQMISKLKQKKKSLKVLLSIGGWGSGNFSEMAANKEYRKAFAADCKRVIKQFNLDGIDIDWEFPTSSSAKISSSPEDTKNYTLLMHDIRKAIGKRKLLTLASQAGAGYIDFPEVNKYIDFVNIMTYDMASAPKHHSGLYRSNMTGWLSCEESVEKHIKAGIPIHKLVLGIPFYGHGRDQVPNYINYNKIKELTNYTAQWDDVAKAPYLTDSTGRVVCNYDDERSIKIKCSYLLNKGMLGAMYWDYGGDDKEGTLQNALFKGIMKQEK